jgi:pyruvate/2-oxoacid:ferredoxin oxidoreductase alpha subunit
MKNEKLPKDPDLLGSVQAMKRSAANALKLARKTHTPCYVVKDGKIVNVAERQKPSRTEKIVFKQ